MGQIEKQKIWLHWFIHKLNTKLHVPIYSRFSVAKATLESQMSVCLSVHQSVSPSVTKTPQTLRIAPIDHRAYRSSSLLAIEPIGHQAYQPSSLSTLALLSRLLSLSACLIYILILYFLKMRITTFFGPWRINSFLGMKTWES